MNPRFQIIGSSNEVEVTSGRISHAVGRKRYELTNHLGNVLTVISDRRIAADNVGYDASPAGTHSPAPGTPGLYHAFISGTTTYIQTTGADGIIDYYTAEIISSSEYSAFGVQLQDWGYQSEDYRYAFQGQEADNELWSGAVSYKYRVEDPRLGRFFSMDPLAAKYPHNSVYAFSENRVVDGIELEGLEVVLVGLNLAGVAGTKSGFVEGGLAFGPDGIFGYASYGTGFESDILGGSIRLSITIYPDMPSVHDAGGEGIGMSGGTAEKVVSGAVSGVRSGKYEGINIQVGIGDGVSPTSISYIESNTLIIPWFPPIGAPLVNTSGLSSDEKNTAISSLNEIVEGLNDENISLYKTNMSIKEKLSKISQMKDQTTSKQAKKMENDLNSNDEKIKSNQALINVIELAKEELNK